MSNSDKPGAALSAYQMRVLRTYERMLEATGLHPERIYEIAEDDPAAVVPVLRSMTDQVVRSEVIFEYTLIDAELDHLLIKHFFGSGKRVTAARKTKRYRTLRLMRQNIYVLQKLSIVKSLKKVPKSIASNIAAINDLRNGLAHTFFLGDLKESKRTYRGNNVFTPKGLAAFRKDALEIRYFFMPWLKKMFEEDDAANS